MNKVLGVIIGAVGGIGFLWAAISIFVWDVGKLQQVRATRDWPQAEGRVTRSQIDKSNSEHQPDVIYGYRVGGTSYTSKSISIVPYGKPGGQGRVETIVRRYPVGANVTVFYDPSDPSMAILEPGDYSPFFMPLLFGVIFFGFGMLMIWITIRQAIGVRPVQLPPANIKKRIAVRATVLMSVVIYVTLALVCFDSAVREVFVKAFGERPLGMPNLVFALALQTLLYVPMPWVFWHMQQLMSHEMEDGTSIGFRGLLTEARRDPHLRRSLLVCIGGFVYFVVICGAWMIYGSALGIL